MSYQNYCQVRNQVFLKQLIFLFKRLVSIAIAVAFVLIIFQKESVRFSCIVAGIADTFL